MINSRENEQDTERRARQERPVKGGRVAVIVAAYRAERWILECAKSIMAQKLGKGWSIDLRIGVDGCHETERVLRKAGITHWFSAKNVGPYVLRNSLVGLGHADHYAIFDADDVMLPAYLWTLVSYAGSSRITGAARLSVDAAGRKMAGRPQPWRHGVCLFPHKVWQQLGGYRGWRVAADTDIIVRAKLLGIRTSSLRQPLYLRRRHAGSLTQAPATGFHSAMRAELMKSGRVALNRGERKITPETTPLLRWTKEDGLNQVISNDIAKAPEITAVTGVAGDEAAVPTEAPDPGFRHSVYTRCRYGDDAAFKARLALAAKTVIPCMAHQAGCTQPVRWCWFCEAKHAPLIEAACRAGGWKGALAFNARDDSEDLQTTLDSDDWIAPDWLEEVQARPERGAEGTSIVYWHPARFDVASSMWFDPKDIAGWPSMFYSVYHPSSKVHVYATKHTKMDTLGVPCVPARSLHRVALVVHGANMHTTMRPGAKRIRPPSGAEVLRLGKSGSRGRARGVIVSRG